METANTDGTRGGAIGIRAIPILRTSQCAGLSDTSGRVSARRFCSRASSGLSTAATTRQASRSSRPTASTVRAVGPLGNLKSRAGTNGSTATTGLGHTRWATHGGVTEANAHPLAGCEAATLSIVLNGIVENYRELKESLLAEGHTFTSETDAETVTHLIERYYEGDLVEAVRLAFGALEGHFAFRGDHRPSGAPRGRSASGARSSSASAPRKCFLASNAAAFLAETRSPCRYPGGSARSSRLAPTARCSSTRTPSPVEQDPSRAGLGRRGHRGAGLETFMLKEIFEQPEAVAEADRRPSHHHRQPRARGARDE